jgi:hypothetical protein
MQKAGVGLVFSLLPLLRPQLAYCSAMEARRLSRGDGRAVSSSNTYLRRSARRERNEEEEETVAQSSKRRRQEVDSRSGSSSSRRGARQPEPVQEEEEEEEEEEAEEEDGNGDAVVVDDDDEGEEPDADGDGGLWGILPIKKLKVSKTAQKAAESIGSEVSDERNAIRSFHMLNG